MNTIRKENRKIMFTKIKVFTILLVVAFIGVSPEGIGAQESDLYKVTTNKITAEAFYCLTEQDIAAGNPPSVFLADISIVESPDGEQAAIRINNVVVNISVYSIGKVINAIEFGINIEASNIKKPLKSKNFEPVYIDRIGALYRPALFNVWHPTGIDIGTIYTEKNKSFYMYFLVGGADEGEENYIMVC